MKMYQLVEWIQVNYPHVKEDLMACNHNYDEQDLNPYHLESDCWSHTMMVCKMAELYDYDKEVLIAALLHDIGKPQARRVNPRNNHVQFFGHEEISGELSKEILKRMQDEKIIDNKEASEIRELIVLHSLLHKVSDSQVLINQFQGQKSLYIHLVQLNRCDSLGRFCASIDFTDVAYRQHLSYAENM